MKKKDFDCVEMKHKIQRELAKERAGLSAEERNRRMEEEIRANPILGPFYKKISGEGKGPSRKKT